MQFVFGFTYAEYKRVFISHKEKWDVYSSFYLALMKNDAVPIGGCVGKCITCLISHLGRLNLSSLQTLTNGLRKQYINCVDRLFNWIAVADQYICLLRAVVFRIHMEVWFPGWGVDWYKVLKEVLYISMHLERCYLLSPLAPIGKGTSSKLRWITKGNLSWSRHASIVYNKASASRRISIDTMKLL